MKENSSTTGNPSETCAALHKPCAGGMERTQLESHDDSWFVAEVKKHQELRSRDHLNRLSHLTYNIETYVASQQQMHFYSNRTRRLVDHIVIPGKVFIRVSEQHRQDVLKQCPLLVRYMMDPAKVTHNGFRAFARVPDWELRKLQELLTTAEGPVEYLDVRPRIGDKVQVLSGRFHGLTGYVLEEGGSKYAIVTLDSLGSFRFRLPISELGQIPE